MNKKVIIIDFDQESVSYQAFSELKSVHKRSEIKGEQMAVVTHREDGTNQFEIKEFIDFTGNDHSAKNSMIGMLFGILSGPLAMMLGWFAGNIIGNVQDAKEVVTATSIFEHVTTQLPEGQTGVVLIAEEDDNRPLNNLIVNQLGGHITRLGYEDVFEEVTDAKKLEESVKKDATDKWNSRKEKS